MLIWLPQDSSEYIRSRCAVRRARLVDLEARRGDVEDEVYASMRKEVVHAEAAGGNQGSTPAAPGA